MFLTISINFHQPMSVQYIFSIAGIFRGGSYILTKCILHFTYAHFYAHVHRKSQGSTGRKCNMVMWGLPNPAQIQCFSTLRKENNPAKNSGFCGEMHVKGRRSGKQTVCWCVSGCMAKERKIAQRIYFCIRNTYKARKIAQTIYFRKKMHAKGERSNTNTVFLHQNQ